MKDFMLLFIGEDYAAIGLSPEEMQARMGKWFAWNTQMREQGVIKHGDALMPGGKTITGENRTVTDGPAAESKELITWPQSMPDNPEAWLTTAAKNRIIDVFRSIHADKARSTVISNPLYENSLDELFLDDEIEDSQLRMIFTACHPTLEPKTQIAFALKTISGFSTKEIAAALLFKEETIKKRLSRARQLIKKENIKFEIPSGLALAKRLDRVMEVIYVLFNEGFHSNKKNIVVRKELCGEALRLLKLILSSTKFQTPKVYALFALLCFHSARLDSKVSEDGALIPLDKQDRTKWYFPLIALGNDAMTKAIIDQNEFSSYHYEAAIAAEHLRAPEFELTNWKAIAAWYESLVNIQDSEINKMNLAVSFMHCGKLLKAYKILDSLDPKLLNENICLYYASMAEYYHRSSDKSKALENIDHAIELATNAYEKAHFMAKRDIYSGHE